MQIYLLSTPRSVELPALRNSFPNYEINLCCMSKRFESENRELRSNFSQMLFLSPLPSRKFSGKKSLPREFEQQEVQGRKKGRTWARARPSKKKKKRERPLQSQISPSYPPLTTSTTIPYSYDMMMSSLISSSSVCPGEYIQHHTLSTPPQSTNRQEKNITSKEIVFASRSRNIYAIHSSESLANLLSQIDGYYECVCLQRAGLFANNTFMGKSKRLEKQG